MTFAYRSQFTCKVAMSNRLQLPIVQDEVSLLEPVHQMECLDRLPILVPAPTAGAGSPNYARKIESHGLSITQSLQTQFPTEQRSNTATGTFGSVPPQILGNGPLPGQRNLKFPRKNSKVSRAIKFLVRFFLILVFHRY